MIKKYNSNVAFLRVLFCIAVLLYHLNILKGGYLAVCSFFVVSGYFSTLSLNKSKSLKDYYIKRIKKIYLPLLVVVFISVILCSFLSIKIFNFKSEITSILFGYNNYFQINANTDYFAKAASSLFTHLWYISILLQIELIYPLIFKILDKISKNKNYKLFGIVILSIIGTIYFIYSAINNSITVLYYDTLSRVFSYFYGCLLGLYFASRKSRSYKFSKIINFLIFVFYLIILSLMFVYIDSSSKYFVVAMILTSIVTTRLIYYSYALFENNVVIENRLIKVISDISYLIYLVQYPVIYFFNYYKLSGGVYTVLIILTIVIISYILNIIITKKNWLFKVIIVIILVYGGYNYVTLKNTNKEIKELKNKLTDNKELMKKKQKEFLEKQKIEQQKQEQEKIENEKKQLELEESTKEYVDNLKVVGIGDSIMLNTVDALYEAFPNGYFDALKNRTICASYDVLKNIKDSNITWDVLVFNLGTNGDPNRTCKENLRILADGKDIFWLTATNPDNELHNQDLIDYANEFDNIHILEWRDAVKGHDEYLYSDNTHLTPSGTQPFVDFIKNSIYEYYLNNPKR